MKKLFLLILSCSFLAEAQGEKLQMQILASQQQYNNQNSGTFITLSDAVTTPTPNEANSYGTTSDSEWVQNGLTRGISTTTVNEGTYSLSATGGRYSVLQFRPATSYFTTGERYKFTFRVYSPHATTYVQITTGFTNFSGSSKVRVEHVGNVNEWVDIVIEGEFTGSLPMIYFATRDTSGSDVTAFLDNLTIEEL